jgi:hypothetical protein
LKSLQTRSAVTIAVAVIAAAIMAATIAVGLAYSSSSSNNNSNNVMTMTDGNPMTNNNNNNKNDYYNQASTMTTSAAASTFKPTNRTFWIDTIHLDGNANIHGDNKHPPEPFPANVTYPKGGGFVLTPPDNKGAWNFRSFTFSVSQIVVYQGDRVTLNFVGVHGTNHYIQVEGIGSFPLTRGQIHTVTFSADKAGTINYWCHLHMPNMHGEILVLPRPAVT